jgi:hypothetical protein
VPVALLAVGCTGSSATPNLSPVSSAPPASVASSSVLVTPSVSSVYPADVPLTGHNVRPGEKPPVYPAAAKARTQEGANAFAEFFMKTLDWAYATTNPSYMKHYYGSTCGLCSGIATGMAKTAAKQEWYEGGRLRIRSSRNASIGEVTAPARYCTTVIVDIGTTSVTDRTGKIITGQGALFNQSFKLCEDRDTTAWRVTYFVGTT